MFSMPKLSQISKLSSTITDMIRFDHSHVMLTFHQYTTDKPASVRKALADTICTALEIHATLEEEIFYPALRQAGGGGSVIQRSVPEHDAMRTLLAELRGAQDNAHRNELVAALMREVLHHMADEETVLLPDAERLFSHERLAELGAAMTKRRMQLLAPQAGKVAVDTAVGFSRSTSAIVAGLLGVAIAARYWQKSRSARHA
jgi:iron-sulfur cluster repair protein YtfE (RIC family)